MYLVLPVFTSWAISLLASVRVSGFFFRMFMLPPIDLHHQNRPEADASHLISIPPGFVMAYSKSKLKNSGDRASPHFRPHSIGNVSGKCLPLLHDRCHLNTF
jgi:hypothetical protein